MIRKFLKKIDGALINQRTAQVTAVILSLLILGALTYVASRYFSTLEASPTDPAVTSDDKSVPSQSGIDHVPAAAFARGSNLAVGVDDALRLINPLYSSGDGELDAVSLVYEPLVRMDSQGNPIAVLARTWSYDPDTHLLTVTLQTGHTFSDGRSVAVDDVLFTYACLLSPAYDGPFRERLGELVSVTAGKASGMILFEMADWVVEPDLRILTLGILNASGSPVTPDRVFEFRDRPLPPDGSGDWQVRSLKPDQIILDVREDVQSQIRTVTITQVKSEQKYIQLEQGQLDLVRNLWDSRMQLRAETLPGYRFVPFKTTVDHYLLVNPLPSVASIIQRPSQRLAVLLQVDGKPLSALQHSALEELASQTIHLYYFHGVEANVLFDNRELAEKVAEPLRQAGLAIELTALSWPELANRAATHDYDILLMPATANNRLPDLAVILQDPVQPNATALVVDYRHEAYIVSRRLTGLTINPRGRFYTATAGTWTDNLTSVVPLNPDGSVYKEEVP